MEAGEEARGELRVQAVDHRVRGLGVRVQPRRLAARGVEVRPRRVRDAPRIPEHGDDRAGLALRIERPRPEPDLAAQIRRQTRHAPPDLVVEDVPEARHVQLDEHAEREVMVRDVEADLAGERDRADAVGRARARVRVRPDLFGAVHADGGQRRLHDARELRRELAVLGREDHECSELFHGGVEDRLQVHEADARQHLRKLRDLAIHLAVGPPAAAADVADAVRVGVDAEERFARESPGVFRRVRERLVIADPNPGRRVEGDVVVRSADGLFSDGVVERVGRRDQLLHNLLRSVLVLERKPRIRVQRHTRSFFL